MTTFDGTLTICGQPFWETTRDVHVETVRTKHANPKKKEVKQKEVTIKGKNGQTKRVVI